MSRGARLLVVLLVILVGLLAFVPPNAEFMPENLRFPYVTFPLLPPLVAIALAIYTQQVLPALFIGVWLAALMYTAYNPLNATITTLHWLVANITDSWNATILLFDFFIGAFVGVLYSSGSMTSLARSLARRVKSSRSASFIASLLGVIVFFDDYSNTIVVGNSMRPLTDKMRVSRELLSYIVDSTAAPVAGMMLVSTWIGYEVSQIQGALNTLASEYESGAIQAAPTVGAYGLWLSALPYHFYSMFALLLVFIVVLTRRHYGAMARAEYRAVVEGKVLRDGAQPLLPTESVLGEPKPVREAPPALFIVSVIVLVAVTLLGMWYTGVLTFDAVANGEAPWWSISFVDALMNADSATALLWASFAAFLVAFAGALAYRSLSFKQCIEYSIKGMYLMVLATAILLLAWSIKTATSSIGTAEYVVNLAVSHGVPALVVPLMMFLASMFISYTTGTSWGTFALMMPIAIPLAWKLSLPLGEQMAYVVTAASIGAVFGGGIFGDHVSPISDTTIMSSMFSACDHIDHVTTQMPYGATAALVSIVLYSLFAAGVTQWYILLPTGIVLLLVLHRVFNKWYTRRNRLPEVIPDYREQ